MNPRRSGNLALPEAAAGNFLAPTPLVVPITSSLTQWGHTDLDKPIDVVAATVTYDPFGTHYDVIVQVAPDFNIQSGGRSPASLNFQTLVPLTTVDFREGNFARLFVRVRPVWTGIDQFFADKRFLGNLILSPTENYQGVGGLPTSGVWVQEVPVQQFFSNQTLALGSAVTNWVQTGYGGVVEYRNDILSIPPFLSYIEPFYTAYGYSGTIKNIGGTTLYISHSLVLNDTSALSKSLLVPIDPGETIEVANDRFLNPVDGSSAGVIQSVPLIWAADTDAAFTVNIRLKGCKPPP